MTTDLAILVRNVSKKFRLFSSARERLVEALHPLRRQYHKEHWALRNVSFDIRRGEIVGVLGRNGSGKSTLLQIICSVMQATQGEVAVSGRIAALLELGAGFDPQFTGRENVLLNGAIMGFSRQEMDSRILQIEQFAEIGEFFDQPVRTYSSGMFVRLAFAAAIHVDPDILIVDEALSVGDSKFQHRCYQRIREFMERGKTILVVSHSTDVLLRLCDSGIVIDSGELKFSGPISGAVDCYHNILFGAPVSPTTPLSDDRHQVQVQQAGPVTGAGSLSADACDRVAEKLNYNSHEVRLGNGAVRIIDFDIVADGELNPLEIRSKSRVELLVKILFNQPLQDVSFGFAIVSIDGTYISGANSETMGRPYISAEGGQCIAIRLHWTAHLVGGEYFLNIGCHRVANGEKVFLDVRRSIAKLKISATPEIYGFADLELEPEIVSLN